jgi:cytochrome c oxidase subunit 4
LALCRSSLDFPLSSPVSPLSTYMSHDAHDLAKSIRKYMIVFVALLVGTVITVLASYINFGNQHINVAVALIIASVKAFLVAGYFMHLISERKMIYSILGVTAFFFAGLMYLTLWSMEPTSLMHSREEHARQHATVPGASHEEAAKH